MVELTEGDREAIDAAIANAAHHARDAYSVESESRWAIVRDQLLSIRNRDPGEYVAVKREDLSVLREAAVRIVGDEHRKHPYDAAIDAANKALGND